MVDDGGGRISLGAVALILLRALTLALNAPSDEHRCHCRLPVTMQRCGIWESQKPKTSPVHQLATCSTTPFTSRKGALTTSPSARYDTASRTEMAPRTNWRSSSSCRVSRALPTPRIPSLTIPNMTGSISGVITTSSKVRPERTPLTVQASSAFLFP